MGQRRRLHDAGILDAALRASRANDDRRRERRRDRPVRCALQRESRPGQAGHDAGQGSRLLGTHRSVQVFKLSGEEVWDWNVMSATFWRRPSRPSEMRLRVGVLAGQAILGEQDGFAHVIISNSVALAHQITIQTALRNSLICIGRVRNRPSHKQRVESPLCLIFVQFMTDVRFQVLSHPSHASVERAPVLAFRANRDRGGQDTWPAPSHTTRHAGPHRAVRIVEVMRAEARRAGRSKQWASRG
jgi:hypothetical protein